MFQAEGPTFFELAVEALSSTERGYDRLAPKFDLTPFRTPDWVIEPTLRHVGAPGSVGSALDVCCGTGAAMRLLRPICRDAVVGVDFSGGMLCEARRRTRDAAGTASLDLVRADALAMPFDGAFDVATCFGAFGHILPRDEPRFVASIARSLKVGGRFVFATTTLPPVSSGRYWVARAFNAAMHVRNAFWRPPFIMYYLTFLLPGVRTLLEDNGFAVDVHEGPFPEPFAGGRVVVATRMK